MKEPYKEFTFEERKQIEKLIKKHPEYSLTKIAIEIKRSKNGVIEEVRKNGGRGDYCAELAQKRRDDFRKIKYEHLKNLPPEEYPMARMKASIESLQMQIDILYEQIKQIKGQG